MNESFEVHDTLNPKLWNGFNLKPEVCDKIIEIVDTFKESCDVEFKVIDIQLVGSNASYNYTEQSDLDVHIITNFEDVSADDELVGTVFNLERNNFNKAHNISLHGVEIEIYVEDVQAGVTSNGIYSVLNNSWIKKPKKIDVPDEIDNSELVNKWENLINDVCTTGSLDDVTQTLDNIYLIRKNSLAIDGEYGKGNQLFKEIRNLGLLQKLKDKKLELTDKELTLENYNH